MIHIKRLVIVIVLFVLLGFKAPAEPEFVVYAAIGNTTIVVSGKIVKVIKGQKLYSADVLNLAAGAKLTLVCSNYNKLDLTKAGKFKIKDLTVACDKNKNSFTAAYFKFVWEEFTHPHKTVEAKPEHYMKTAGAVTRGKEPVILALAADTLKYYKGDFKLQYAPESDTLTINFYSAATNRIVKSSKISGNIPMGTLVSGLKERTIYTWKLMDKQRRMGPPHTLVLLSEEKYKAEIVAIVKAVTSTDPAETAFMIAFLMEKNHFLSEAESYYKAALKLNPANSTYRQFANRFM